MNIMSAISELPELLQQDLLELPEKPGVYLMRNQNAQILYIGKAKNLLRRVRSYFTGSKDMKTELLRRKVARIEVLLCASDYEALILENNLIKKHKPRYNIQLKDDKSYPLICITGDAFPRIFKTRQIRRDGSQYFGPYPNGLQIETTVKLLSELFPLRRCKGPLKMRERPCLYYHIKKCMGPCIGAVSQQDYRSQVQRAKNLLQGHSKGLQHELERDMRQAAEELRFEAAAQLRDQIQSLQSLKQDQGADLQERPEVARDYLAMLQLENHYFFTILLLRNGKLLGHHHFSSRYLLQAEPATQAGPLEQSDEPQSLLAQARQRKVAWSSALVEFLCQYYLESGSELPNELHLPELDIDWEELELFLQLLEQQRGERFLIRPFPRQRGQQSEGAGDRRLLLRAKENAIREQQLWLRHRGKGLMLEELRAALNLNKLPQHIEGFDISHMDGHASVASLIVFQAGKPAKESYRSFNLRNTEGKIDDFASIQEATSRRYTRLLNEEGPLPDLILIDGGQGQVNAAAQVLRSLELTIPLVGLAKREEILFFPALPYAKEAADNYSHRRDPLDLPPGHPGLKLLQQVRDECHRRAHGKNRQRYQKRLHSSVLENVPGIGKKRSNALLKHYGSLEKLGRANSTELSQIAGIGEEVAQTLVEYLARRK